MERKRAVMFMMKILEVKSVSKKPGQKPFLNRIR
jgi:hypothetical protein